MIMTIEMWNLKQKIDSLKFAHEADPGDYLVQFELEELEFQFKHLEVVNKLGLKCIVADQSTDEYTQNECQAV